MPKQKMRPGRIYYGPPGAETSMWWPVKVPPASAPVTINGSALHAMKSLPGVTIGCSLSNTGMDEANKKLFPHPVHMVVVTASTVKIIDKLNAKGHPCSVVLYKHRYSHITDMNDKGTIKAVVAENPELMERPFTLYPPDLKATGKARAPVDRAKEGSRTIKNKAIVHRGALQRARKSGLIGPQFAAHLIKSTKASKQN